MKLSEYVLKTREERTAHIDLTTECELGTFGRRDRGDAQPLLDLLGVEDDLDNWTESRVHRCHMCEQGRHKGECGNPRHIYLGSASENAFDIDKSKREDRRKAMYKGRKFKEVWLERERDGHIFWFESANHASEVLGLNRGNLGAVLRGGRPKCEGYRVHSWGSAP